MINLATKDWELTNIDTILFDKDGTFIDLHYFWGKMTELRANEVIKQYNLEPSFFGNLCLALGYDIKTNKMIPTGITALYSRPKIISLFTQYLNENDISANEIEIETIFDRVNDCFYQEMEKYTKPIDSTIEFIKTIKKLGIKTGIVTSDSKESTLKTLKHYNWESLFDVVIGRECTTEPKESGEPVKLALKELNSSPQQTVMVGDAPMDYLAAKNAGVEKTILLPTGQITIEELQKTSEYTVESLAQLIL